MKLLKCIVRPAALDGIKESLGALGVHGMTVSDVKGFGRQKGHRELYRGAEYLIDFVPKLKVEIVLPDQMLDLAVSTIREAARSGEIGDGKIFVLDVKGVIRIRTGETGDAAV
jgi:nitrogen regulatory protein P-II 1